jgi:hypothetical protein
MRLNRNRSSVLLAGIAALAAMPKNTFEPMENFSNRYYDPFSGDFHGELTLGRDVTPELQSANEKIAAARKRDEETRRKKRGWSK